MDIHKSKTNLSSNVINDQKQKWSNKIEDYNLLDLIGSGSFGRVFRSYCKQNDKECAVKCIPKQNSPNIKKILTEVYIHIRLSHPNILQLHTVIEDNKAVYLVMEICHGGSLSQLINNEIRRRKCLDIRLDDKLKPIIPYQIISAVTMQLCHALEYLHRNSIVHRDINLNNILLDQPLDIERKIKFLGQVKLADFGLAIDQNVSKSLDDNESIAGNTICGTPGFISPEVWNQRENASYKSDIFSLGSIIYGCITGHTPKGDIDLSSFLPMTADLIGQLLKHNPKERPELEQIKQHIFVSGRIDSSRLFPIEKTTNTMKMAIDQEGNAEMYFIKDNLSIKVSRDGSTVFISHNSTNEYKFYELPEKYWKRYLYVAKFVNLVKTKTSKISINCSEWFKNNEYDKEYISKCVLMNNGNFEITFHDEILNNDRKLLLDIGLKSGELKPYENKLMKLYRKILNIEQQLEQTGQQLGMDMFPVTFGIDSKLLEDFRKQNLTENNSFLTSKVLQSVPINGIGYATQFTNGSIKVNFNDGSDLCMDRDNQIFFLRDGVLKKFHINQTLPEMVVNKIAQLPKVIEHLREMKKS